MFLTNLSEYSNKKLRILFIIVSLIYFLLTMVAPIFIIGANYRIFKENGKYSLTGLGLCLLVVFAVIGLRKLKEWISKLPQNTMNQRRTKFSLELVFNLIVPAIVILLMVAIKMDFDRAFTVLKDCMIFYIGGVLVDNLILKYLVAERESRFKAEEQVEIQKRFKFFK